MKRYSIILFTCIFFCEKANAQMPDSVRHFIDSVLHIMQKNSIYTNNVNWQSVTDSIFLLAKNARNYADTKQALQYAFNALGDKHGWLVLNDTEYRNRGFVYDTSRISENIKKAASSGPKLYNGIIAGKYVYINIPFFGGQTPEQMQLFAQRIQDSICKNVSSATKGFIIDLRLNAGGNVFPMYAGISNILGNGIINETKDNKGNSTGSCTIHNNNVLVDDSIFTSLKTTCGDFSKYPVAVIIGPVTGSAGECLAVSFVGRLNSILIGEQTAGYTSANLGFLLPGENNGIVIGVDLLRDRNGKLYNDAVLPDIAVSGDDFFDHTKDKKIQAAVNWLHDHESR